MLQRNILSMLHPLTRRAATTMLSTPVNAITRTVAGRATASPAVPIAPRREVTLSLQTRIATSIFTSSFNLRKFSSDTDLASKIIKLMQRLEDNSFYKFERSFKWNRKAFERIAPLPQDIHKQVLDALNEEKKKRKIIGLPDQYQGIENSIYHAIEIEKALNTSFYSRDKVIANLDAKKAANSIISALTDWSETLSDEDHITTSLYFCMYESQMQQGREGPIDRPIIVEAVERLKEAILKDLIHCNVQFTSNCKPEFCKISRRF